MADSDISMVQECCDKYLVKEERNGDIEVTIQAPKRFAALWMTKLSDLRTTETEIEYFQSPD